MTDKTKDEITADLALAKQLVAEGKIEIGNDAAKEGGRAVVAQAGYRKGVIVLQWSRPGVGFGELTLVVKDGRLVADRECMSLAFCLDVLKQALIDGSSDLDDNGHLLSGN